MTDCMSHRGPDARGTWISSDRRIGLGHRRLSIIDLDPRSNQPFFSDDGSVVLVFNGEIYNFTDIRKELEDKGHRFRTTSDTEVIVRAYAEWDLECVRRFRGMFAFGLVDQTRKRVWLVRDRVGIKPLIYSNWKGVLSFASDIGALSDFGLCDTELDLSALYDYLTYLYIPAPKTAFRHIRKLEPGHWLLWEDGTTTIRRYWDISVFGENIVDEDTAVKRVRDLLDEAVRLRLVADVPVGVLLSGGMDSSSVAYYALRNAVQPLHTFSVAFAEKSFNEVEYANTVAKMIGSRHVVEQYDLSRARSETTERMFAYGEPHGDVSIFPTTLVCDMARRRVTVALSGDGGDEVFWGYTRYLQYARYCGTKAWGELARRLLVSIPAATRGRWYLGVRVRRDLDLYVHLTQGFARDEKARIVRPEIMREFRNYDDCWAYERHWRTDLPLRARLQYLDFKNYLPDDILAKVDRASMTVSLEARVPLLDHKLVEEVFSWPDSIRSDGRTLKYIFKKAMRGILPDVILTKPKQGFCPPWFQWTKDWPELRVTRGKGRFFREGTRLPNSYPLFVLHHWLASRGWQL